LLLCGDSEYSQKNREDDAGEPGHLHEQPPLNPG
jgi:hypothetical protein